MLTQAELKSIVYYCERTGTFTRKVNNTNTGTIDKSTGYVRLWINKKLYHAHRCAFLYMTGNFPCEQIDHINGIRDDNRFCNLRVATNSQNSMNKKIHPNNTSGYKGVYFNKQAKRWASKININKKQIHIGFFDSPIEASIAYINKAKEIHGEFFHN